MKKRVVIVGNGMVSWKLCARLSESDSAREDFSITVVGEEPRPAYDRVQLTKFFETRSADSLELASAGWYAERGIELLTGQRVVEVDRSEQQIKTDGGTVRSYDSLVLATGSAPFVPPISGVERPGVFVYRTIEDLTRILAWADRARTCAVLGGGLLGLEAARAVQECGLETHVVELAPRLMPRQLDDVGALLLRQKIEQLGVSVRLGTATRSIDGAGDDGACSALQFDDGSSLDVDMVVVSAGIRPRDELARKAELAVGPRGGIVVDDWLATSDPNVFAVGECALHRDAIHGLVAPGYDMARVVAARLRGDECKPFEGGDTPTKLKLMGVDVASFGDVDARAPGCRAVAYQDFVKGIYKKLVIDESGQRLIGGILVGDASEYAQLCHLYTSGASVGDEPEALIVGSIGSAAPAGGGLEALPDEASICSCNSVTKGQIRSCVREGSSTFDAVKLKTTAGSGCGGCAPQVVDLVQGELAAMGQSVKPRLCEHFDYTRQELFDLVRIEGLASFEQVVERHGTGHGCEICKPTIASILASLENELIVDRHATLQDTNDRFLANIQRKGLYSVVPRVPAGEITPDKLIRLGEIARKYDLYTKITGGQRIDMFGARLEQLPDIWQELVESGFESGHAYGKSMRTVKSCVGNTWCRYGVQDSVTMAIRIEERYRGLRAPHKLKSAVSGCIRECAEAQSKDFGVIATEKGWNLYVCGNGGSKPRHADLLASDLDDETLIRFIDRFLMYYIATADKLTRTSVWLDKLDGGIDHVRRVVVEDSLGLGEELEVRMQKVVDAYECEWKAVVERPELRKRFRQFVNSDAPDDNVEFVPMRDQKRPADWPDSESTGGAARRQSAPVRRLPVLKTRWIDVGAADEFPRDGGAGVKYGDGQLAVFNFASRNEWYATQNMCPHRREMVLARGIVGDRAGEPKVACPFHKKQFSLVSGECLTGEDLTVSTFPVKVAGGRVLVELPPAEEFADVTCGGSPACEVAAE